jgi:predicted nucleic acid-binding protein
VNYLFDVNVLLAWGWQDHIHHRRAASWIAAMKRKRGVTLLTASIPELGFVRVSVQRSAGLIKVADAAGVLSSMLQSLSSRHVFLVDDRSSTTGFPVWCLAASATTDGHLLALAHSHGAELATLDAGIPGAYLLPAVT